jgi:hypothetical protein
MVGYEQRRHRWTRNHAAGGPALRRSTATWTVDLASASRTGLFAGRAPGRQRTGGVWVPLAAGPPVFCAGSHASSHWQQAASGTRWPTSLPRAGRAYPAGALPGGNVPVKCGCHWRLVRQCFVQGPMQDRTGGWPASGLGRIACEIAPAASCQWHATGRNRLTEGSLRRYFVAVVSGNKARKQVYLEGI